MLNTWVYCDCEKSDLGHSNDPGKVFGGELGGCSGHLGQAGLFGGLFGGCSVVVRWSFRWLFGGCSVVLSVFFSVVSLRKTLYLPVHKNKGRESAERNWVKSGSFRWVFSLGQVWVNFPGISGNF